ncbi:MAG: SDR family NAD(P)-dependent oxidoreductase [Myxococcales bacterium]|jgi:NAD(P)-dependent dehydrogenase (short-subunit alcohol dehydrogenase family)|nr:SDR family NAD(P)-dependent oxidoreductase [Myxococcales bacterium]
MTDPNDSAQRVCLITGVGPGTGSALVRRFIEGGYRVAMLARNEERLKALANELGDARAYVCDVTDSDALGATIESVKEELGVPTIVIHNAVGGAFGSFQEIDPEILRQNFEVNTMALLHLARFVVDDMIQAGGGAIIATGNTSAYRGKAAFAGFAPSKAAQRILIESIARSAGPQGVHAAYLAIDAVIDLEWTRKRMPDAPDDFFCKPADIAEAAYQLVLQPKSAWASEMVIRPFGENW